MAKKDKVLEMIKNLDDDMLLNLWRNYCDSNNDPDNEIFSMDDFDEFAGYAVDSNGALWLTQRVYYGNFNPNDSYWGWSAYGNLKSFSDLDDDECPIDMDALADYLIDGGTWDYELDMDELVEAFKEEYNIEEDIEDTIYENGFNALTDDWDDFVTIIKEEQN